MGMPEDIGTLLIGAGYVDGNSGWKLAIGWMPPGPDAVVALFQYAGNPPPRRIKRDEPGLQVRVRGVPAVGPDGTVGAHELAMVQAERIRAFLHDHAPVDVADNTYRWISAQQSPFPIYDENGRAEVYCNFIVATGRGVRAVAA
jgi:hypothetical protein